MTRNHSGKKDSAYAALLQAINDNRWAPQEQLPPLPHLAREIGFSHWATDSAQRELIEQGILFRRPKKGTYIAQPSPVRLLRAPPVMLACDSDPQSWFTDAWLAQILQAFAARINNRDWMFLRYESLQDDCHHLGTPLLMAVNPPADKIRLLERLTANGMQILCVGGRPPSDVLHCVAVDNAAGVNEALRYLAQLGHRRVAFLRCLNGTFDSRERYDTFLKSTAKLGMARSSELVVYADSGRPANEVVREAVSRWFGNGAARPTAILTGGEETTVRLLPALAEKGIRFPADVSIVSFDDPPSLANMATPVTAVRQPLAEMGRCAARIYGEMAARMARPMREILPVELVVRASCAPV